MELSGETDELGLVSVYPLSAEEARTKTDNVIEFTISGKNTTDKDIYYEIKLTYGDDMESPYERFHDEDLAFDLVEIDSENNETYLLEAVSYESFNNKRIWVKTIDANINKYDSAIKQMIDHWYVHSGLTSITSKLEDTIYCNDRSIYNNDLKNWDLNKTTKEGWTLYFKTYGANASTNTLTCVNVMDQFSVSNSKAKLTYPIGLLTEQERSIMMNKINGTYARTGLIWWQVSPYSVYIGNAMERYVHEKGNTFGSAVSSLLGVRPVITLSSNTEITEGNGTYDSPFLVE